MIPILFEAGATEYSSNGIGRFTDATYCAVTEERNGEFVLEMEIPTSSPMYPELREGRIIYAQARPGGTMQPFEIWRIMPPINGIVNVYAPHISYRLNKIVAMPFTASSCADALNGMATNAANECPFVFWTDKTAVGTFDNKVPTAIRSLLGGQTGSILDVYGTGEYEFDGYNVMLHVERGVDNNVTIQYGKNLIDLTETKDATNVYTGIVPYYANDVTVVTLPEFIIWGAHASDYAYQMVKAVDFTQDFESAPTESELRAAAETYISASSGWQIDNNLKVKFVNLADTEEYKDKAVLQYVNLCDTVTIVTAIGETVQSKVVRVVYDVLSGRYTSIEVGSASVSLGQAISDAIMADVPTTSMMQTAITNGTQLITGGLGGYVVLKSNASGQPEELLVMDGQDYHTAQNIWRFNRNGIGYSSNGYDGDFNQAWTIDGAFYTDWVTAGMMTANIIKAGILSDAQGLNTINMETGEIHLNLTAADVGAVSPQELTTQLTVLNGQITSQIEETRTEIETYYFCPPNQTNWWRYTKYNDYIHFGQNEDGSRYVELDGTSLTAYTSDAYIWQLLAFSGSGSYNFSMKFSIIGTAPQTVALQNFVLFAYTRDSNSTRYISGFRIRITDGVVTVLSTGGDEQTPDEDGVYKWNSSKAISKSGSEDRFALYFVPGAVVRYELANVEMTTTTQAYYYSTQTVVDQKLGQLEMSVAQLEQQSSANYIPETYLDPGLEDWYVSPGDPVQIVDYQGEDAIEFDGTDVTQTNWQYDILRIPLAQIGTYAFQFSAWTDVAFTPASGEVIARFYYCCENPAASVQTSVPVAVIIPASFSVSARQSAAGTEVIYSGQITIPEETTVTYNGTQYTAATRLMSRDANYGTFGVEFYFSPGVKRYIRNLTLYGSATDYARSVLSIASDMIQQEVERASSVEGNLQAQITVNADEITQRVSKNGVISAINQTSESVTIDASKINLNGYVTIAGLGSSGNVAVDGSRITNGTVATAKIADSGVTAAKIASNAVTSAKVNSGAITTVKIADGAITAGKVAANAITADKIHANAVTAGKIAAGAVTAGKIAANAITSDKIAANAITGKTITGGTITQTISGASTGGWSPSVNGRSAQIKNGIVTCGELELRGGESLVSEGRDDNGYYGIKCTGHFSTEGTIWCGDGSKNGSEMLDVRGGIWCNRIYSLEGGGWLSDRREKHNIVDIPKDKAESFILSLKPVSYELNARPGVVHHGFIAQDVQPIAYDGWGIVSEQEDMRSHEVTLALSYTDFIADMVSVIQTQAKKIEELERRINSITEDDGK